MIHYHGTPISPRLVLEELAGRNFCVSFAKPQDVKVCHRIGQSVMLDNGAFTAWKQGRHPDWDKWRDWAEHWLDFNTTWAVLPDVIEGTDDDNDRLLLMYGDVRNGAPVWHLHESLDRLLTLVDMWPKVCFGSSEEYAVVRSPAWHRRITEAFDAIDQQFKQTPWIHMLRGMALSGSHYPFSSVDSTDIAQNHWKPQNNIVQMANKWDGLQCPPRWERVEQFTITT